MSRPLSLAHLTAIDLPPPAFIEAAAEAGFDAVGLRLIRVTEDSPGYPLNTKATLTATQDALRATGIKVADVEFLRLTPEFRVADVLPMLDIGAALGARHVIAAPYDDDLIRLSETLGALAEASHARGLMTVLEFFPWTSVPDLESCWEVVQRSGDLAGVLIDSLHFDRSRSELATIAEIPPARLPFAHLCDAPVQARYTTEELLATARGERLAPGEGEIDLAALIRALPQGLPLGIEVPGGATTIPLATRLRHLHNTARAIAP